MEEKYYTPKTEEFHYGFCYQSAKGFQDGTVKTKEQFESAEWVDDVVVNEHDLSYIQRALSGVNFKNGHCGIRVKYLDREDIESLGWTKRESPYLPATTYLPKSSVLESYYKGKTELYMADASCFIPNKGLMIYQLSSLRGYGDEEHRCSFKGNVKNKSEFKKVMEMLGIK